MSMKTKLFNLIISVALIGAISAPVIIAQGTASDNPVVDAAVDSVVTILLAADGQTQAVGSGLVVRSDGYILTPYSIVRGAGGIQVRLRNGETFDGAEIVSFDERRNVAILRIKADGLRSIPNGTTEETQVGSRMFALSNPAGQVLVKNDLMLNSVQMADSIPGAGKGYRLLQFDASAGGDTVGGLLLDARGRSLGLVTTTPEVKGQNIAVPLSSVMGLIRAVPPRTFQPSVTGASYPSASQTPVPIPQSSVLVPQRGVTPLPAKGPGSVVVKPSSVPEILALAKTIYVTSNTQFFKPDHLVNALNGRKEMAEWKLTFVDERELADLIIDIDHVVLTYKFTFKIYSPRLGTVVATGSRIIWDGNLGAPYMADRVVEKLMAARGAGIKTPNVQAKPDAAKTKSPDGK